MEVAVSATAAVPPQPKGNFIAGHLAPITRDPLGQLTKYAREYGDVVKLRLVRRPVLLVSHPELIEKVLVSQSKQFAKSIDIRETRILLGDGLLTTEGEMWRRWRRAMQPAFHQKQIADYCDTMTRSAEEISVGWQDGEERDLRREMTRITLRTATRALFGAEVASEESDIGRAIDSLFHLFDFTSSCAYLLPNYLPTPIHVRALAAMRRLDRLIERIIEARRPRTGRPRDLLDMILAANTDGGAGNHKMVRDQVMTLLVAGHETTSAALTWCWYLLGQNPDAEYKFHEEVDRVLGGRPPRRDDLERLPYTERIFDETMRLYPPAWMMGREATEDTEIGGYAVPKGTTVYVSQWVVQRDPRFYCEPDRFQPDRWSEELSRSLPTYAYFPFGGGPRMCIGASFARAEGILALATVGQRFRFELKTGTDVKPWPSVTLRPHGGLPVTIHRRFPRSHALGPDAPARQAGAVTPEISAELRPET
jgi:cytochrome P450